MDPEPVPVAPSRHPLNVVFQNDRGLRAGWRLLIYIALLVGLSFAILIPVAIRLQQRTPQGALTPIQGIGEALSFLIFLLAAFVMSLIERRNMGEYGLP